MGEQSKRKKKSRNKKVKVDKEMRERGIKQGKRGVSFEKSDL